MEKHITQRSFFSISFDLIVLNTPLKFDIFINSSIIKNKQKYIRIYPRGSALTEEDVLEFKEKYPGVYVPEDQRKNFFDSLKGPNGKGDVEVVSIIKDEAIKHLHNLFDNKKEFSTEVLIDTISSCRDSVESMVDMIDNYNIDALRGLIGNLSAHDFYTYDHSINVSMYCISILRALEPDASRERLVQVGLGGLLHDLGKVKISTSILNSPLGLSDEEYDEIKKHPQYGIDLLQDKDVQEALIDIDLNIISRVVHEHHENWNGTGYPNKLKEEEIHYFARICAVADFFDAITTKRSYADVLTISQAIEVMASTREKKIDPEIFDSFVKHVKYSKVSLNNNIGISEKFDPAIPYAKLPLVRATESEKPNYGKVIFVDNEKKKKEKKWKI